MTTRVMIVDDNPDLVYMVQEGLKQLDDSFEVIGANSGPQCFEMLNHEKKPDIILLDIMMPGMNGWDVFAQLRTHDQWMKIPVVFLTAKTDDLSRGFGTYHTNEYICKPFQLKELKQRIDTIVQEYKS